MASTTLVMVRVCWQNDNMLSSMLLEQELSGTKYLACYYVWHGKTTLVSVCALVLLFMQTEHTCNTCMQTVNDMHMHAAGPFICHGCQKHCHSSCNCQAEEKQRLKVTSLPWDFTAFRATDGLNILFFFSLHWNKSFCENTHTLAQALDVMIRRICCAAAGGECWKPPSCLE